jgi:hypothetical protein
MPSGLSRRAGFRCESALRSVALVLALACGIRGASAAEVVWSAPKDCPDRAEMLFRVERILARPLERAAPGRFQARVQRGGTRLDAWLTHELASTDARLEHVEAVDCFTLSQALAVMIGFALTDAAPEAARPPSLPQT